MQTREEDRFILKTKNNIQLMSMLKVPQSVQRLRAVKHPLEVD
jgi:hypothetical protein